MINMTHKSKYTIYIVVGMLCSPGLCAVKNGDVGISGHNATVSGVGGHAGDSSSSILKSTAGSELLERGASSSEDQLFLSLLHAQSYMLRAKVLGLVGENGHLNPGKNEIVEEASLVVAQLKEMNRGMPILHPTSLAQADPVGHWMDSMPVADRQVANQLIYAVACLVQSDFERLQNRVDGMSKQAGKNEDGLRTPFTYETGRGLESIMPDLDQRIIDAATIDISMLKKVTDEMLSKKMIPVDFAEYVADWVGS